MKVVVLGGGVIGITTAYYLARQGAEVTVLDRQPGVAQETSFANAGQVSPGYAAPWAAPGIPLKALRWMFQKHAPLAIRPDGSLYQLRWMAQMLRNCSPARYAVNKERMMRLAEYSRDCLRELRAELDLPYAQRTGGTLQLFRTQAQLDAARRDIAVLRECGVPYELLDVKGLLRHEPGLAQAAGLLEGGLRLPNDETGDCHLFTRELATVATRLGVRLRLNTKVDGLITHADRVDGVRAGGELFQAERYVMAFGSYSRQALGAIGLDIPVYPVKVRIPLIAGTHSRRWRAAFQADRGQRSTPMAGSCAKRWVTLGWYRHCPRSAWNGLPVIHAARSAGWVTGAPEAMRSGVLGGALSTAAASLATNADAVGKAA